MNKLDTLTRLIASSSAAIFDFDNVIVDSEPYHYEAYARVFAKRGHTLDRDTYWLEWTSRGGGAEGEIKRHRLDMNPNEIRAEKDPIYAEFCGSGAIKLFPQAHDIIAALRETGLTLAIASGSYERDIRAILRAQGLENYFKVIVGKDGIKKFKPHPDTYLAAARKLGIAPMKCLAIEDAEKGITSAHDAGMRVILIETLLTRDLHLAGADLTLTGLDEFRDLLSEITRRRKR
jgi:HAD superfamily hydrolase (TIGR01509 family)